MKDFVTQVVAELTHNEERAVFEMDAHYGRGPTHVARQLGVTQAEGRKILASLKRCGVVIYGPLFSEDGLLRGRGNYLGEFGLAVRDQLELNSLYFRAVADLPMSVDDIERMNELERLPHVTAGRTTTLSATNCNFRSNALPAGLSFAPPIGLSGFAGSGKTEAAKFVETFFGYERQHIAEPLRRMLASLLREYGYDTTSIDRYLTGDLKEAVVPELGVTSRHLQITLGTEWGREQIAPDVWAHLWARQAAIAQMQGDKPRMNDSVRFPNEEDTIRAIGGITILIERPGTGPAAFKWKRLGPALYRWFGCMWGVHDSERVDRLRPDHVLVNDGTITDMTLKLEKIIREEQLRLASGSVCQ